MTATKRRIPQFVIAAPASGAGKTMTARGLMAVLGGEGMSVQPFKCGPDYIDPKFHTAVCGRESVNIDLFMAGKDHARALYARYSSGADACVVEGMMGMFDGYDAAHGSTAEIAAALELPVVLVVDARSTAYSLAPLLFGFMRFDNAVSIAGVIFNMVGSARHERMLSQVCRDVGLECFGYIPKEEDLSVPSRYLGLDLRSSADHSPAAIVGKHVDWRRIVEVTMRDAPDGTGTNAAAVRHATRLPGSIVVAKGDEAFAFVYRETMDVLRLLGEVRTMDPVIDELLPPDTSLLYLPGGYPENVAGSLSAARSFRLSVRDYALSGGRILAECGGMMYLCRTIITDGGEYEMADVLPYDVSARQSDRHLSLGYRQFAWNGQNVRGHEFHYSQFRAPAPASDVLVRDAAGNETNTAVMRRGNVIAGYTHLYLGGIDVIKLFERK